MNDVQSVASAAVAIMQKGGAILYPTDTIWGLGCDARNATAIEKLYEIKERPHTMSMLVLVESIERLKALVGELPAFVLSALQTASRPTTIIYPAVTGLAENLPAPDGSLGIRLVKHSLCSAMITALDAPIVSTSANISGQPTATNFAAIDAAIKVRVDWIAPEIYDTTRGAQQSSRILKIEGNSFITLRD